MNKLAWVLIAVLLLALIPAQPATAQGTPSIGWWVIGSGGGSALVGSISLGSTLGQWDIGSYTGGSSQLQAGFWGGVPADYRILLPITLKQYP